MADRHPEPDSPELRAQWGGFAWSKAKAIIGAIDVCSGSVTGE